VCVCVLVIAEEGWTATESSANLEDTFGQGAVLVFSSWRRQTTCHSLRGFGMTLYVVYLSTSLFGETMSLNSPAAASCCQAGPGKHLLSIVLFGPIMLRGGG
jgi:hypothetical protein